VDSFLASLGPWIWFIAAAVLMALELALPGAFMVWFGIAAAVMGVIAFQIDYSWPVELLIFAVLALGFAYLGRRINARHSARTDDQPFLNRRAEILVGRVFILAEPIVSGSGAVRIDDSIWRVRGDDAPSGTKVKVKGVDGATLLVEAA